MVPGSQQDRLRDLLSQAIGRRVSPSVRRGSNWPFGSEPVVRQALLQEQVVFERDLDKDRGLTKQQQVLSWLMIPLPLALVAVTAIEPGTAPVCAPLSAIGAWHWRTLLKRNSPRLASVTVINQDTHEAADQP